MIILRIGMQGQDPIKHTNVEYSHFNMQEEDVFKYTNAKICASICAHF